MLKLTRRNFLKLGAAGASLVAAERAVHLAQAGELVPGGASVSRTTGRDRRAIPSTCQLCPANCGIIGYVEDGRLVKIEGNPEHPNNRGKLCAKGQAGLNQLYDPQRILYPMRRAGARGEGKWERISWNEALDELANRLKNIQSSGQLDRFVFQSGVTQTQNIVRRFLNAYGTANVSNGIPLGGENKDIAQHVTWGAGLEVNDAANSRYILVFGSNPFESHPLHVPLAQRIVEGRMKGAKLVTFDVRLSNTAGRSDEWFPINPGTDAVVALAMANVIMQEGLYDAEFISKWTNYSAAKLADHLKPYTPERAEEYSGVKAEDIRRIAREFATRHPGTIISGAGVSSQVNGVDNVRCVHLLAAMTGNIDNQGGNCLPRTMDLPEPDPAPLVVAGNRSEVHRLISQYDTAWVSETMMPLIREGRQRVGLYMTYMHNPAYSDPDTRLTAKVLRDEKLVPYYVVADIIMSESAALADLVLPDTTYLERWGLESMPSFELVPFISLRQPLVEPAGESLSFEDVVIHLAKRIGGGLEDYFDFSSSEDYFRKVVAKIAPLSKAGGFDLLKKEGVWFDPEAKPTYKSYKAKGFTTASGSYETYSSVLAESGYAALPVFEPPSEPEMAEDELALVTYKVGVHSNSKTANCKWLAEIFHENPVWIHPETAKQMGIHNGDTVKLSSAAGSITSRVRLTQGVHPKAAAISGSAGHWEHGNIAQAKAFVSKDADTRLLWWEKHGNGVNPNTAVSVLAGPLGKEQAWMNARVKVSKVI